MTAAAATGEEQVGRLRLGERIPDLCLPDHSGNRRLLSELVGPDPTLLVFYRGWWCPKEQQFLRRLVELQDDAEVAYARFVCVSVDPSETQAAFRAGLGARWIFLSDSERRYLDALKLREGTDTLNHPYAPTVALIDPELTIRGLWNGYWYWGRPSTAELWQSFRHLSEALHRAEWVPPREPVQGG